MNDKQLLIDCHRFISWAASAGYLLQSEPECNAKTLIVRLDVAIAQPAAQPSSENMGEALTETSVQDETRFVQRVPDHCDRIVWRNRHFNLLTHPPRQQARVTVTDEAVNSVCARVYGAWGSASEKSRDFWREIVRPVLEAVADQLSSSRAPAVDRCAWMRAGSSGRVRDAKTGTYPLTPEPPDPPPPPLTQK